MQGSGAEIAGGLPVLRSLRERSLREQRATHCPHFYEKLQLILRYVTFLFVSSPLYDTFKASIRTRQRANPTEASSYKDLDEIFLSSEVFVTTNVTEYYYAGTDQEHWYLTKHFPNLAPVFDAFWMETKAPTHIRSTDWGTQTWEDPAISDLGWQRPKRWAAWFVNTAPRILKAATGMDIVDDESLNAWTYAVTLFTQDEDEQTIRPFWNFYFAIDKETGQFVADPNIPDFEGCFLMTEPATPIATYIKGLELLAGGKRLLIPRKDGSKKVVGPREMLEAEAVGLLKPFLLALSFLHCKNVERVPQYPSPKLNKKRQTRNLPPLNKFHTLEIASMKRILQLTADQYRGVKGVSGIEMALHKCRGHFKHFTPEKPLFGHHVGTWFWSDHERGTIRRGTVTKRYEVKR